MPDLVARRGDKELSQEEFRAHLAQAIRLENVGVLLGAGASCCAGGITMDKVWENFLSEEVDSIEWLLRRKFIFETDNVNLEQLIDSLEVACIEWKRGNNTRTLKKSLQVKRSIHRQVIMSALLQENLWSHPMQESISKLNNHKKMLIRLVSNRQPGQASPWIFTTNYDLAVEWSAEALELNVINGFSGTHCRKFTPNSFDLGYRNISTRGEAQFGIYNVYLAKLHGSLTWEVDPQGDVLEWQSAIQKEKIDKFLSRDDEEVAPGFLIYPGMAKFIESTGFVYGEMIRRFSEYLSRANTCLIINGYGFRDEHINKVIARALQNPTLQLVVYYADEKLKTFDDVDSSSIIGHFLKRGIPQLTVCIGQPRAHFENFVEDLPEPALMDEQADKIRDLMKLLIAENPQNQASSAGERSEPKQKYSRTDEKDANA